MAAWMKVIPICCFQTPVFAVARRDQWATACRAGEQKYVRELTRNGVHQPSLPDQTRRIRE